MYFYDRNENIANINKEKSTPKQIKCIARQPIRLREYNMLEKSTLFPISESILYPYSSREKTTNDKLFENMKKKAINNIFDILDSDKDGYISYNSISISSLINRLA